MHQVWGYAQPDKAEIKPDKQGISGPCPTDLAIGADVVFSYTVGIENAVIANGRKELKWKVPQVGAWTPSPRTCW